MIVLSKEYNLDKGIILNAVYDALDEMKFSIEEANRDLGFISISKKLSNSVIIKINLSLNSLLECGKVKTMLQGASENGETKEYIEKLFNKINLLTIRF